MAEFKHVGRKYIPYEGATNKYAMIIGVLIIIYGIYDKYYGSGSYNKIVLGALIFIVGGFYPGCLAGLAMFGAISRCVMDGKAYSEITKQNEWALSNLTTSSIIQIVFFTAIAILIAVTSNFFKGVSVEDTYEKRE